MAAVPELLHAIAEDGARALAERAMRHPLGVAVGAVLAARREAQKGAIPCDAAAIIERAAELVRAYRSRPGA